ncbi:MAG TPA: hypothetical protein VGO47_07315, partial [Chlamydiales bacterium]|nr:hypothetical protein [Chlamydiales bacterium]
MIEPRIRKQMMYMRPVGFERRLALPYSQREYPERIEHRHQHNPKHKYRRMLQYRTTRDKIHLH